MQISEKISAFQAICSFFVQFCVKDAMKIFTYVGKKKTGKGFSYFCFDPPLSKSFQQLP